MTVSIRRLAISGLLLGALLAPSAARAWGDEGHEIIALVAYRHLEPRARAAVDQILGQDDDLLTDSDIVSRSTWADKYRDSDRHTSQRRYRLTRAWHFVDIELDHPDLAAACFGHPAAPASTGPANSCIVDRIEAFAVELHDLPPGDPERTIALKFVLHLVGDIHQPLHAADNHDRGGTSVLVLTGRETVGRPLHAYWDTGVVRQLGRDSNQVAFRLSAAYRHTAGDIAAEHLEKAGCRLAMVLNRALGRDQDGTTRKDTSDLARPEFVLF